MRMPFNGFSPISPVQYHREACRQDDERQIYIPSLKFNGEERAKISVKS
jgi:hypothetical protein